MRPKSLVSKRVYVKVLPDYLSQLRTTDSRKTQARIAKEKARTLWASVFGAPGEISGRSEKRRVLSLYVLGGLSMNGAAARNRTGVYVSCNLAPILSATASRLVTGAAPVATIQFRVYTSYMVEKAQCATKHFSNWLSGHRIGGYL